MISSDASSPPLVVHRHRTGMDQIPGLSRKVSVLSRLILDQSRPARRLISPVGGLRMRCEQRRETLGIAARHAALGRHAVGPDVAPGGGEASSVAGHVVAVNETEIKFGFRAQIQPGERCE